MAKNKTLEQHALPYPSCRTWALANPRKKNPTDLPMLLRRVADQMEQDGIRPMEIRALTVDSEMTADGPWWSVQVFWSPADRNDD